ncbi:MAG TPA: TIGR03663 family protein [Methanoregulaceae archaeon]|nr:TIGR03663 family protein [Methanoregulaceae archaeon]HQJ86974.1 TIGR03663 family protein [Methanoregulaceae archaeon]
MPAAEVVTTIRRYLSFDATFLLLILATAFTRFYRLNLKLFHHDEAIHAWFSYELLTKGTYTYDPMYHGPILYYITAGMFRLFGDSDLVGRLVPALLGVLIVVLVYFIYRIGYLDQRQSLVAGLLIMISPDMVYFSRFLRHDIFMLFFTLLLVVALLYYLERRQLRFAALAAVAAGLALSCKEEMPLILIIFGAYILYLVIRRRLPLPETKIWVRDLAISVVIIGGVMAVLYSFFGMHLETLWTGPFEAINHWLAMHGQQRLGGPPYFYVLLFGLYEVPIVILAGASVVSYAVVQLRRRAKARIESISAEIDGLAGVQTVSPTGRSFDRRDEFFKFCLVWMAGTMVMYGYIGEKVPWLIVQQLLPMCFVASWCLREKKPDERLIRHDAWKTVTVLFLIVSLFVPVYGFGLGYTTYHVQFDRKDISEPIVQVQNSEDLRGVFRDMNAAGKVVVASQNYWPLPWYYRGDRWNKIQFYGNRIDENAVLASDPDVVLTDSGQSYPSLPGYEKRTVKLNYWFSWYDNQNRVVDYYFNRDGKLGSMNLDVFTKIRPLDQIPAGDLVE